MCDGHQSGSRPPTAHWTRWIWRRRTRSIRCTRRATTESGTTVALVEMSGAGYSSARHHATSPTATASRWATDRSPRRPSTGAAPPVAAPSRPSSTSRRSSPWRPRRTSRSTRAGPPPACTTSSTGSSATTPPRSSAPAGRTGARPTSASPTRTRRTRFSRRRPLTASRSSWRPGDQGAEGCNVNGVVAAPTGSQPVAQVVDATHGHRLHRQQVLEHRQRGQRGHAPATLPTSCTPSSVPDGVRARRGGARHVAREGVRGERRPASSLTVFSTGTCNQADDQRVRLAHTDRRRAVTCRARRASRSNGSTLYVANANGTLAVYNANTNAFVTSVTLPRRAADRARR